jgi:hypothetical protein
MENLKEIQRGQTNWTEPYNENVAELEKRHGISAPAIDIANRLYDGVDLSVKFTSEILIPPHNGSPWSWIRARIRAGNFEGINVGDFIPFTAAGNHYLSEVAGINTYKRQGDTTDVIMGNHIDFITRDCHPDTFQMNRVNYNNGIADGAQAVPFLSSELFQRLNSRQGNVPTSAAATPAIASADFRTTGIFHTLPADLRAVIVEKRVLAPTRRLAANLLIDDTSWAWNNIGMLWLPFEVEVFGTKHWGSKTGHEGGFLQYPIFASRMDKIVKGAGHEGVRSTWWLASAAGGNSTAFCSVHSLGPATSHSASHALRVPLCFRIA